MTTPNIYCDKCSTYMDITLQKKKHPRDIREVYFKCGQCHYHYTVSVTDKRVRKVQRKMKQKGIRFTNNKEDRTKEQTEIEDTMSRLKSNLILYGVADL